MTTQIEPAVVPNFDDEATAGRKLAIICSKAPWTWPTPA